MKIKKFKISLLYCVYIGLHSASVEQEKQYLPTVSQSPSFVNHLPPNAQSYVESNTITYGFVTDDLAVLGTINGGGSDQATDMVGYPVNINSVGVGATNVGGPQGGQVNITAGTSSLNLHSLANPLNANTNSSDTGVINIGNSSGGQVTITAGTSSLIIDSLANSLYINGNNTTDTGHIYIGSSTAGAIDIFSGTNLLQMVGNGVNIEAGGSPLNLHTNAAYDTGAVNIGSSVAGTISVNTNSSLGLTSVGATTISTGASALNLNNGTQAGAITVGNAATTSTTLVGNAIQLTGNTNITGTLTASGNVKFTGLAGGIAGNNVQVNGSGSIGTLVSSARYKEAIVDIKTEIINNISLLRPRIFSYKKDIEVYGEDNAPKMYGFIAEEVEEVDKNLVIYREGRPESLYFNSIFSLAVAELILLKSRFDALEKEYSQYRNNIELNYTNKIESLEHELALLAKKNVELQDKLIFIIDRLHN